MVAGRASAATQLVVQLIEINYVALDSLVSTAAARNLLIIALVRERRTHPADASLLSQYFVLRIEFRGEHFDLSRVVEHLLL